MRLLSTETLEVKPSSAKRSPSTPSFRIHGTTASSSSKPFKAAERQQQGVTLLLGYRKVADFCRIARANGYRYVWFDTRCI